MLKIKQIHIRNFRSIVDTMLDVREMKNCQLIFVSPDLTALTKLFALLYDVFVLQKTACLGGYHHDRHFSVFA